MASISCRCGDVVIHFTCDTPRVTTECCCNHCFARVRHLEELGGPKILSNDKPLLNTKWDNKLIVEKGREKLFAYKMTPKTMVLNIASSCCHTFLLGRNSVYDANCVTTGDDFPAFSDNTKTLRPSSRWFSNQWGSERLSKLDYVIGIWVNEKDGSLVGEDGWEKVLAVHMTAMQSDIRPHATGETFEQIIESIGVDNIKIVSN